jgi:hypothetical protein
MSIKFFSKASLAIAAGLLAATALAPSAAMAKGISKQDIAILNTVCNGLDQGLLEVSDLTLDVDEATALGTVCGLFSSGGLSTTEYTANTTTFMMFEEHYSEFSVEITEHKIEMVSMESIEIADAEFEEDEADDADNDGIADATDTDDDNDGVADADDGDDDGDGIADADDESDEG